MNPNSLDPQPSRLQSRRDLLTVGMFGGAGVLLAGGGIAASLAQAVAARAKETAQVDRSTTNGAATLYMLIATPAMLGTGDNPAYIPAYATIPANARVRVEIVNFDDATPLTGALAPFAKVKGTVDGAITTIPLDHADPNQVATGQIVSEIDPENVSHTFTIAELNINVPVAAKSRTIFTLTTGGPGTYLWRCNDPCGTGSAGWGGAMGKPGFMMGKLTVA